MHQGSEPRMALDGGVHTSYISDVLSHRIWMIPGPALMGLVHSEWDNYGNGCWVEVVDVIGRARPQPRERTQR
jgi:hypothetical protein